MKRSYFVFMLLFVFCATVPRGERVAKYLGDLAVYSEEKLIESYYRADGHVKDFEAKLTGLESQRRFSTADAFAGGLEKGSVKNALGDWREVRLMVLLEMKKRKIEP